MSDLLRPTFEFTTIYGANHQLGITPKWNVELDGFPVDQLKPMAAVMMHGLLSVVDTVQTRASLYDIARQQYTIAVHESDAVTLPVMDEDVPGSEFGKFLSIIMNSGYSPLDTNVLALKLGVKDKILIATNTQDEEAVWDIINATIMIDRPEGNARLQSDLIQAFERRRSFLLRNANRTKAPAVKSGSRASSEYITSLSRDIVEVSTSATRASLRPKPSDTEPKIDIPLVTVTPAAVPKPPLEKSPKIKEEPTPPAYLPSEIVVREVGNLIFNTPEGVGLTDREIAKVLKVGPSDSQKVNNVLLAMRNAGYLGLTTRDGNLTFTRTDLPKPQPKTP